MHVRFFYVCPERDNTTHDAWLRDGLAPSITMILPQVHLRKPCYDLYFL